MQKLMKYDTVASDVGHLLKKCGLWQEIIRFPKAVLHLMIPIKFLLRDSK